MTVPPWGVSKKKTKLICFFVLLLIKNEVYVIAPFTTQRFVIGSYVVAVVLSNGIREKKMGILIS